MRNSIPQDKYAVRPGTTYDIHFKKSEEPRLNEYSRKVASGWAEDAAVKAVAPV
jgi:hypothetical protein